MLAFISLLLPWWALDVSTMGPPPWGLSLYLFQATAASIGGATAAVYVNLWFGWTALALVVVGGLLSLTDSVIATRRKTLFALGEILVLLSLIVFVAGLQNQISSGPLTNGRGFPTKAGVFSTGKDAINGDISLFFDYSTYLSYGFWLALVAAIIMFAASLRKPPKAIPPSQPLLTTNLKACTTGQNQRCTPNSTCLSCFSQPKPP
jgi:hypothetical protein